MPFELRVSHGLKNLHNGKACSYFGWTTEWVSDDRGDLLFRQNSSINSTNHLISHSDFGALKRRFRDSLKRKIPCLVKARELPGSAPDRLSGSFGFLDDLDFFETGNICFGNPDGRAMPDHRQERRSHFSFARRVSFA